MTRKLLRRWKKNACQKSTYIYREKNNKIKRFYTFQIQPIALVMLFIKSNFYTFSKCFKFIWELHKYMKKKKKIT